jgi:uncharacterized protein
MENGGKGFQVFAKPVGAECNLRCSYCYYTGNRKYTGHTRMDDDLLEKYIVQQIDAATGDTVMFSWHGGEPVTAGLDFYKKAVLFQKRHIPPGKAVINGIQTNGTLLNEEWCRFLAEEKFMAGISIDGPEHLHNAYRITRKGGGSFQRVMHGYYLLQQAGVQTEILCVIHSENVRYPIEVYQFFKHIGARFLTFLPLVEKQQDSVTGVTSASVPADAFGHFLIAVFDEWIKNDIGKIQIQLFEEALRPFFNREHTLCIFKKECGGVPVVDFNGDFYTCDHYVDDKHLLGNIRNNTIAGYLNSNAQNTFGRLKYETLPSYCRVCEVREMCNGECPKNRFIKTPDGESGLNYLCEGYKLFFKSFMPFAIAVKQVSDMNKENNLPV